MDKFDAFISQIPDNANYSKYSNQIERVTEYGLSLISKIKNLEKQEYILKKLISKNPENPALYYYLGFMYKDINHETAYTYFKKSYDINPENVENMIEICSYLLKKNKKDEMIRLNKNNLFDTFLNDWRFVALYFDCMDYISNSKCLKYLKQVTCQLQSKQTRTPAEDKMIIDSLLNISQIYCSLCIHHMGLNVSKQAIQLAKMYNAKNYIIAMAISSHMYISNYMIDSCEQDIKDTQELLNACFKKTFTKEIQEKEIQGKEIQKNKKRKINVGYISSDFVQHAVSNFILPIIENHSSKFCVYVFSNDQKMNSILSGATMIYYNINNMTDDTIADLIKSLKIDILFELNGHTRGNRLNVFSYRPAPIAISYIGYPNTTALDFIDYRITDNIADHPESTQYFTEKRVYLPNCFLLYKNYYQKNNPIPKQTLEKKILSTLNKESKINEYVLDVWKRILKECPNTTLLIKLDTTDDVEDRQKFYTKELGVDKSRIILIPFIDAPVYLSVFSKIDILLDTFPYSGTTTTCNALHNSVPVVTMYNKDIHAHNVSSSILKNAGLSELITYNEEEYISKVKELVNNDELLDSYKSTIRDKFVKSMDPVPFMENYEKTLIEIYENHGK
jgi:predicted O-linked N-acetylglucosamine transferase (SPINDLY family)